MNNDIIRCPNCQKIFFYVGEDKCPLCGKDRYEYPNVKSPKFFNDIFKDLKNG